MAHGDTSAKLLQRRREVEGCTEDFHSRNNTWKKKTIQDRGLASSNWSNKNEMNFILTELNECPLTVHPDEVVTEFIHRKKIHFGHCRNDKQKALLLLQHMSPPMEVPPPPKPPVTVKGPTPESLTKHAELLIWNRVYGIEFIPVVYKDPSMQDLWSFRRKVW